MIIRIIAVDPRPRDPRRDTVVWQVPEHSREEELLRELLETEKIEYIIFKKET
jgi:hypothetical protein